MLGKEVVFRADAAFAKPVAAVARCAVGQQAIVRRFCLAKRLASNIWAITSPT
jgi:hypothetical protein